MTLACLLVSGLISRESRAIAAAKSMDEEAKPSTKTKKKMKATETKGSPKTKSVK